MTTMTPTAAASPIGRFDIGRVGRETFDIIRTDPIGTYGLAVGLGLVPVLLSIALTASGLLVSMQTSGGAGYNAVARVFSPWFWLTALLGLVVSVLIYGALGYGAVERLQGRSPTIGQRLSAAAGALLPMIAIAILGYIGIFVGTVLFIVPGIFLCTMWLVAFVAAVVDRAGVFGSFSRSAALTKNHRWMIFLLFVIFFVMLLVIGLLQMALVRAALGAGGTAVLLATSLVGLVIGGAVNAVGGTGVGVVYQELRRAKGEFDPGRLAEVFS